MNAYFKLKWKMGEVGDTSELESHCVCKFAFEVGLVLKINYRLDG